MSEKKCDLSITKSVTIPTGNYGNVRPTITLTMKDVPVNKMDETYKKMTEAADAMWALEAISLMEEDKTINELGYARYLEQLKRSKDVMLKFIQNFSETA